MYLDFSNARYQEAMSLFTLLHSAGRRFAEERGAGKVGSVDDKSKKMAQKGGQKTSDLQQPQGPSPVINQNDQRFGVGCVPRTPPC